MFSHRQFLIRHERRQTAVLAVDGYPGCSAGTAQLHAKRRMTVCSSIIRLALNICWTDDKKSYLKHVLLACKVQISDF